MAIKNGHSDKPKPLTDEQLRMLAELILQSDERIDTLFEMVLELSTLAGQAGWKVTDAQEKKASARQQASASALAKSQRQRLRKSLGLD
jgi:hypothetical protein